MCECVSICALVFKAANRVKAVDGWREEEKKKGGEVKPKCF
jgi:hypothetical protein